MARDEDDDDNLPPIGEGTEGYLEDAKKGKPRAFLLICKGVKVQYLKVKKKPIKKAEIAEAKKLGYKGESYIGVLTGKGMELVFNLAISDGYESEPVKDKALKDFLEDKAGFKCKPSFAIVAAPPAIPFDDEDLKNPLVARFMALGEQISEVLDVNPAAEAELAKSTSAIRELLQNDDFNGALPKINALEIRLKELASGTPPESSATSEPPVPPAPPQYAPSTQTVDSAALKLKLQEALNKLVPQLKQAVATYPDKKVELLSPVAEIKKQLDAGELQEARQGILTVGQSLKSLLSQASSTNNPQPATAPETDLRAVFNQKLTALMPHYDRALRDRLGDTDKFRTVMTYATEQAEASVFANAIKAIDRLAQAIQAAASQQASPQTPPPGQQAPSPSQQPAREASKGKSPKMAFRIARLEWAQTCDAIRQQLRDLKAAIIAAGNQFDSSALSQLDNATDQLYSILGTQAEKLQERFDEDIESLSPEAQQSTLAEILKQIDEYESYLSKNSLVQAVASNPFGVTVAVKDRLAGKVQDLRKAFSQAQA